MQKRISPFTYQGLPWNSSYKEKEDINHVNKIRPDYGVTIVYSRKCCENSGIKVRGIRPKSENTKEGDLTQHYYRPAFIRIMAHEGILHFPPIFPVHGHMWPYLEIQNLNLHY